MASPFSDIELEKFRISWLAWKDIKSQEFLKGFKRLWNLTIKEIETLFRRCNYQCNLQDIGKVGLTLQPNVSFAFSPIRKGYFLNVWSFFFCLHEMESSIFFRPSFLLANELLHEYTHYKFWQDHSVLDKDKKIMEQFEREYGLETEKCALTEEAHFLKKLRHVIPKKISITLFRVRYWTSDGIPFCEGVAAEMPTRDNINSHIEAIERAIPGLSSKQSYDNEMTRQKTKKHAALSSILKLEHRREWPIVEMEIP